MQRISIAKVLRYTAVNAVALVVFSWLLLGLFGPLFHAPSSLAELFAIESPAMPVGAGAVGGLLAAGVTIALYTRWPTLREGLGRSPLGMYSRLDMKGALLLAFGGAIGEGVFFRGAVQTLFGLLPAAFVYGLLQMIGRPKLWPVAVLHVGLGLIFGLAYDMSGSLWAAVLAQAGFGLLLGLFFSQRPDAKTSGSAGD